GLSTFFSVTFTEAAAMRLLKVALTTTSPPCLPVAVTVPVASTPATEERSTIQDAPTGLPPTVAVQCAGVDELLSTSIVKVSQETVSAPGTDPPPLQLKRHPPSPLPPREVPPLWLPAPPAPPRELLPVSPVAPPPPQAAGMRPARSTA